MKNLTKPVLAVATIAAIASGLALAQGGLANAASASDCAVAVSLPTTPISATTAATTTIPVTTTWTGLCTTELNKSATATFAFASAATADGTATPITAIATFTSRTLTQGTGTTSVAVPTSALPAVGSYLKLQLQSSTTTKDSTPTPAPTATSTETSAPTSTATAAPITFATAVTATSNAELVKSGTSADIKYTRIGKSVVIVGHAYTYTATTKVGQSGATVQLQKLVGTDYQTVATTTTSTTGRYQFSVADTAASTYRVSTADSATVAGNTSPSVTAATFTVADTKVIRLSTTKVAKKATIKGTLFVRSSVTGNFKATSGVAAELQKKLNGSWVNVKKVRSTTAGSISGVVNNVHKTAYRFVVIQNTSYKTSTSTSISR